MSKPNKTASAPLFGLGAVTATPAVLAHLATHGKSVAQLLDAHVRGDWGSESSEVAESNQRALENGSQLLSEYLVGGRRVYCITAAEGDLGVRVSTMLLFAGESSDGDR